MSYPQIPTRKEYLRIRLKKVKEDLDWYFVDLRSRLDEWNGSLDRFEELITEIEQLRVNLDIINSEYEYRLKE